MSILAMLIYLLEMTVYDPALPGTRVLRYSSGFGYNDASAPAYYEARIRDVTQFNVTLSADPRQAGPRIAAGSIRLKDEDNALKALFPPLGIAGFAANLLVIDADSSGGGAYSSATAVLAAKMAEPIYDPTGVTLTFQDRSLDLQVPIATHIFAGSNALPAGTEGTSGDVGGQFKPVSYGRVRQIAPPQVNSSRGIDQLHDGQSNQILAVRAGGVAWTVGAARTFANIDNASDPASGVADYFLGDSSHGSYARRDSAALNSGPFTYDLEGDARGGTWRSKVADIANELVGQRVTSGPTVYAADITALNSGAAGVTGLYNRDNITVADGLNLLLPSAQGKWWLDANGVRLGQLTAPSGSAVINFRRFDLSNTRSAIDADIISWKVLQPDLPIVWKVTVRYQRFWSTQTNGLDANIDQALRGQLQNEWRASVTSDASVLTQYPAATEITVDTALDAKADADALAASLLAMLKVRADTIQLDAQLTPALYAAAVMLGEAKSYDIMDYGATGRGQRILGRSAYDPLAGRATFKVWG